MSYHMTEKEATELRVLFVRSLCGVFVIGVIAGLIIASMLP